MGPILPPKKYHKTPLQTGHLTQSAPVSTRIYVTGKVENYALCTVPNFLVCP